MKKITELDGVELLHQMNKTRKVVAACLAETGIMEIRKRVPNFTGKETKLQKAEMLNRQARENINAMLDALLEEHPETTLRLFDSLFVYEENEDHLNGIAFISAAMQELTSEEVMRFFTSCLSLANIV